MNQQQQPEQDPPATPTTKDNKDQPQDQPKIAFKCSKCHLHESVDYVGTRPPFVRKSIAFTESTFVMRDPFQPWGSGHFLAVGGTCNEDGCAATVCMDCSVFYKKRFCLDCAQSPDLFNCFPREFQARIVKKADNKH